MSFDVTCLLTCHGEGNLVHRTLRSLHEAKLFAARHGVSVEIFAVLDRANPATRQYFESPDTPKYWDRIIHCDVGDAGLARNFGVKHALGKYIAIMDGDDLVCENWFEACFKMATGLTPRHILHSQWILTFDRNWAAWEQWGQDSPNFHITNHVRINYWSALCFAHRSVFEAMPYVFPDHKRGFGYEDMHWNCQTLAEGYQHAVVPNTIHFVRLKNQGSRNLNHVLNQVSLLPTKLFSYPKFVQLCERLDKKTSRAPLFRGFITSLKEAWHFPKQIRHEMDQVKAISSASPLCDDQKNFHARRMSINFARLLYYWTLRPIFKFLPSGIEKVAWMAAGTPVHRMSKRWNVRLPSFVIDEMHQISRLDPELFPSEPVLRKITVAAPHPKDEIGPSHYAGILTALKDIGGKDLVIVPKDLSPSDCEATVRYFKNVGARQLAAAIVFDRPSQMLAESLGVPKENIYAILGADDTDFFPDYICQAVVQLAPTRTFVVWGIATDPLILTFARQLSTFTKLNLFVPDSCLAEANRFYLGRALYQSSAELSSIQVQSAQIKQWILDTYWIKEAIEILAEERAEARSVTFSPAAPMIPQMT